MARLRYTGTNPVYLPLHYKALRPGDEFDVHDDAAESFTRRPDFEQVKLAPPKGAFAKSHKALVQDEPADNEEDLPSAD